MGNWKEFEIHNWITPEEASSIINSCPKEKYKLLFRTMWETGGRVSEVLSLIPRHVNTDENSISLQNLKQNAIKRKRIETESEFEARKAEVKKLKEERKDAMKRLRGPLLDSHSAPLKTVYLFPESTLCEDLHQYAKDNGIEEGQWLFQGKSRDGRISAVYIWMMLSANTTGRPQGLAVRKRITKQGKYDLKYAWPHLFRHGAAMYMLKRTGRIDIVQEQLGHSTVMTTEGYAKATKIDRKDVIEKSEL